MDRRTVLLAAIFAALIGILVFVIAIVFFVNYLTVAPAAEMNSVLAANVVHMDPDALQIRADLGILPPDLYGSSVLSLGPGIVCCSSQPGDVAT